MKKNNFKTSCALDFILYLYNTSKSRDVLMTVETVTVAGFSLKSDGFKCSFQQ